jgi:predicted PurR-regulated permease PerM
MEEDAMAKELLPDALWAQIAPLLPPKPKGGRPRVSDRAALTGILFVLLGNVAGWFVSNAQKLVSWLQSEIAVNQALITNLESYLGNSIKVTSILGRILDFVSHQIGLAFALVLFTCNSIFLAFLFILEMPTSIARSFQSLSDVSQREFGILVDKLSDVWNGWLRSTVITSLIIDTTTALELFIFGIPYSGILGVITGFLNLISTFGPFSSYLLIIFVTYNQGSSYLTINPFTLTLIVWGINLLINQFVRLVIFPRLAGKAIHLPVFFVIIGLLIAAVLWGVIGVILVIPLLGTIREVLQYVLRKINRQEPYPGEQLQEGFWTKEISSQ